jgi:hypothetical protein
MRSAAGLMCEHATESYAGQGMSYLMLWEDCAVWSPEGRGTVTSASL